MLHRIDHRGDRRLGVSRGAVLVSALGVAVITGHTGGPWRFARIGLVLVAAALVWLLGHRAHPVVAAAVWFVIGCLVFPAGLGIFLPYLTRHVDPVVTVAGLVALVGGLALVGLGITDLVRYAGRWRRVALVPALAAAVIVSVIAFGQAVAATDVPRTAVGSVTPADLGLPFTDVTFATTDGVQLSGWYLPSTNRAAVAVLHGAGSTRSAVLGQAAVLAGHGYGVLLFDARGHGRSEGRAMDFGWYGDQDVTGAVSFLASRPDVDPGRIAVLGLSMGGEEAIGAAAADSRIAAVVAEGATHRIAADRAWLSTEYGWRGTLQEGVDRLTYAATDLLTPARPPGTLRTAVGRTAPRPVLLIAGGAVADEEHAGRFIRSGSPTTVELWVVPGAGHTAGLTTRPAEWEAKVTGFLDAAVLR